jgi:hypothetical protein
MRKGRHMSTTDFSDIVGVFRERSHAEQAMESLKQAGFGEEQFHLTEYNPPGAEETPSPKLLASQKRFIVMVKTPERDQEAAGIMAQHGANNTDLPAGIRIVHGTIITANAETVDLIPGSTASTQQGSSDSLFGEVQVPGHPGEIIMMGDPNAPQE